MGDIQRYVSLLGASSHLPRAFWRSLSVNKCRIRNGDHPFQVFPGYVGSGPAVWLGHRVGMVPLAWVRFVADFGTGWVYWLFCHKANSGRTLGMAGAGVRLARAKDSEGRPRALGGARLTLRYIVEYLSAAAAQRWQWWIIIDLVFLYIYRGGQYAQDVIAGTAVLAVPGTWSFAPEPQPQPEPEPGAEPEPES